MTDNRRGFDGFCLVINNHCNDEPCYNSRCRNYSELIGEVNVELSKKVVARDRYCSITQSYCFNKACKKLKCKHFNKLVERTNSEFQLGYSG